MTTKKQTAEAPASVPTPQKGGSTELTLDEFCKNLSLRSRRVEAIGGFYAVEKRAGRLKDAEAAYSARFEALLKQPM